MSIKKYAGDKIVGLSSDTKPSNVPDGATFYETDTKKIYVRDGGTWEEMNGSGGGSPTGTVSMWATATAPTGWLLCDGSAVNRTTYADLFALLSTTYGAGDGSTTFNLPNFASRFPLGYSASAPTKVFTFSSRSGNTITITGADSHAHNEIQTGQAVVFNTTGTVITGLTNATTYYLIRISATSFQLATSVANANAGTAIALSGDGTGTRTFTATYTVRPLGQQGGEEAHALNDSELPSHDHRIPSVQTGSGTEYASSGDDASCTKQYNPNFITNTAGNDTPHNNMPLFSVINFIIKT
jgi:microcystin-dependent protein